MNSFWDINTNVQISTALLLIVMLLMYIAFKLSGTKSIIFISLAFLMVLP